MPIRPGYNDVDMNLLPVRRCAELYVVLEG